MLNTSSEDAFGGCNAVTLRSAEQIRTRISAPEPANDTRANHQSEFQQSRFQGEARGHGPDYPCPHDGEYRR